MKGEGEEEARGFVKQEDGIEGEEAQVVHVQPENLLSQVKSEAGAQVQDYVEEAPGEGSKLENVAEPLQEDERVQKVEHPNVKEQEQHARQQKKKTLDEQERDLKRRKELIAKEADEIKRARDELNKRASWIRLEADDLELLRKEIELKKMKKMNDERKRRLLASDDDLENDEDPESEGEGASKMKKKAKRAGNWTASDDKKFEEVVWKILKKNPSEKKVKMNVFAKRVKAEWDKYSYHHLYTKLKELAKENKEVAKFIKYKDD